MPDFLDPFLESRKVRRQIAIAASLSAAVFGPVVAHAIHLWDATALELIGAILFGAAVAKHSAPLFEWAERGEYEE